jgi:hypothetical protein
MAEKKKKIEATNAITKVALEWHGMERVATAFATNMTVQCSEHDALLSFFEVRPPILTGTPEENLEELNKIGFVRAECVARVGMSAARIPDFIEALKTGYENLLKAKDRLAELRSASGEE